ncbi:TetR/AcrR family transcriptional regulator [Actinocorallia longicatena]|uniref:TetR/AcrR family transcriptional regulator n=1 Tax=Actinocorallia longicatena TaxID=111803 RepID=A0ABP6QK57_9ACTN
MSPRKSVLETAATRTRILDLALETATSTGLEALTIGTLAAELGMSKAGVIGHFGTKETLQVAVVETAVERFRQRVTTRAADAAPGTERLLRAHTEWFAFMTEKHAGCFLTAAASEFDARPGPVRDAILGALAAWSGYVRAELETATASGALPRGTDLDQLAFDLTGAVLATDQAIRVHGDPRAPARGLRALARLLGGGPAPRSQDLGHPDVLDAGL